MRRRNFNMLVGGAAATWPFWARAQQSAVPVIGFVRPGKREDSITYLEEAFRQGLKEVGYVENENVVVERRWLDGHYERLPDMMAELVSRRVAVITTLGATATALAAKAATQTIPIVFYIGSDPVEFGLVVSLAHPGGNITGVAVLETPLITKRLDLLQQLMSIAPTIALLTNPANPHSKVERRQVEAAARSLGLELNVANAKNQDEINAVFPELAAQGVRAIMIGSDPYYLYHRNEIAALAARYAIPAIAQQPEYAAAGGLMSYGSKTSDNNRLTGIYVGRILKGEKPADMPVQQPTKFEFVINLKTAKALGLTIPDKLLAIADAVIEWVAGCRLLAHSVVALLCSNTSAIEA